MAPRYIVTERLDPKKFNLKDPIAQAMKLYSGIFDLRDTNSVKPIHTTDSLQALRTVQARMNSKDKNLA